MDPHYSGNETFLSFDIELVLRSIEIHGFWVE